MDERFLRWYCHVGCTADDMLMKIYDWTDEVTRRRRLQKRWTEAVSELFRTKCITDKDAEEAFLSLCNEVILLCKSEGVTGNNSLTWWIKT